MSCMKEFVVWLAESVYQYRMSDGEIYRSFLVKTNSQDSEETITWLREQIQVVRDDPKTYQNFLRY